MDKLLTYLLVGAGAYYIGRKAGERRAEKKAPKALGPLPKIPHPGDPPLIEPDRSTGVPPLPPPAPWPGPGYTDAWRATDFDVRIYPKGVDRTFFPPPAGPELVHIEPGCEVIAIGEDAWLDLEAWAVGHKLIADDRPAPKDVAQAAVVRFAGGCATASTAAAVALRKDITDMVLKAYGYQKASISKKRNLGRAR